MRIRNTMTLRMLGFFAAFPFLEGGMFAREEGTATTDGKPFEGFTLHLDAKMHFPGDLAMVAQSTCKAGCSASPAAAVSSSPENRSGLP